MLRRLALLAALAVVPATAGAALSYVGAGTLRNATGNATTAFPAGYAAGDLCIVVSSSYDSQTHTLTNPSGWTLLSETNHSTNLNHTSIFYRVVTSNSETAPTVNRSTSTARIVGRMQCYRGAEPTLTPYIAGTVQQNTTTAGGTLATATPAATTTEANSITMHIFTTSSITNATQAVTSPTGVNGTTYSSGFNAGGTSTTRLGIGWYSLLQAGTGTTGTSNVTTTQADKVVSQTVIVRPAISAISTLTQQTATGAVPSSAAGIAIRSTTANMGVGLTNPFNVTVTVPSIQDGDLVVALISYSRGNPTNSITSVSGPNLGTMTSRVTQYVGANHGEARVYANAYSGTTLTNEVITLACNNSAGNDSQAITVVVLSGADTTALSTTGVNSQAVTTAGTVSVTATGPNSYLLAAVQGWTGAYTATAGTDTTELSDQPDAGTGNSNYAARSTNTGGSGSRTLAWTWATANITDSAAIEIKASAGGGAAVRAGGGGLLTARTATGAVDNISSSGGGGGGDASATIAAVTGAGAPASTVAGGGAAPSQLAGTGAVAALQGGGGGAPSQVTGTGTPISLASGGGGLLAAQGSTGALSASYGGGGASLAYQSGVGGLNAVTGSGGGANGSATIAAVTSTGGPAATYAGGGGIPAAQGGTGAVAGLASGGGGAPTEQAGVGAPGSSYGGGGALLAQLVGTGAANLMPNVGGFTPANNGLMGFTVEEG